MNAKKDELIDALGHDIANPLCAITLNVAQLLRELEKAPDLTTREKAIQSRLGNLSASAAKMNDQLIDFLTSWKKLTEAR